MRAVYKSAKSINFHLRAAERATLPPSRDSSRPFLELHPAAPLAGLVGTADESVDLFERKRDMTSLELNTKPGLLKRLVQGPVVCAEGYLFGKIRGQ